MRNKLTQLLIILLVTISCATVDTLYVVNSRAWPPFSFQDESGTPVGILVDLWKEIGVRTGKEVVYIQDDWQKTLDLTRDRKVTLHAGLFKTAERDAFMDFSTPLRIPLATRLFVARGVIAEDIYDLGEISVGVTKGGYAENYLDENYPFIKKKTYPNSRETIMGAVQGEIRAFVVDYPAAMYYLSQYANPEDFHVIQTLYEEQLRAGVPEGDAELLHFINNELQNLPREELQRITQKWLYTERRIPTWILPVALGAILSISILFGLAYIRILYNHKRLLKNEVTEKTEELRQKNVALQEALDNIKTLSGILPICSHCKKIKNSEGYWDQVEAYIRKHSDADFSHGLCEECAKEFYGDLVVKEKSEQENS